LNFAILLSVISIAFLNFIKIDDSTGMICGLFYSVTALAAIAYSGVLYTWRITKMRQKAAANYHDPYGPTILSVALLGSIFLNVVLRLREL
jgi:hypothetical protein